MKIGLFTDTFYPEINGVATSCLTLEQELTRRGHEVHVFAPKCRGWEENQRGNIHYLASAPFLALKDRNVAFPSFTVTWEAEKLGFDVVHTNSEFIMGHFGRHIARRTGCALVHTYHTVWEDYTYYIIDAHLEELALVLRARVDVQHQIRAAHIPDDVGAHALKRRALRRAGEGAVHIQPRARGHEPLAHVKAQRVEHGVHVHHAVQVLLLLHDARDHPEDDELPHHLVAVDAGGDAHAARRALRGRIAAAANRPRFADGQSDARHGADFTDDRQD